MIDPSTAQPLPHPLIGRFAPLCAHQSRVPLEELEQWLRQTAITIEHVQPFLHFDGQHYVRNLLYEGPAFHALVLCWRNGQRSPIHDHQGSSCAVKILQGTATETFFQKAPNEMIYATGSRTLSAGDICGSQDADIHQVSNLQAADADLVTLHIYSPPLIFMNTYSLIDRSVMRVVDPINDQFALGAGI